MGSKTAKGIDLFGEIEKEETAPIRPAYTLPDWTESVLKQLEPTEYVKTHDNKIRPKCDGLRRIFDHVMGTIINSTPMILQCPSPANNNRAVVLYTIQYIRPDGDAFTISEGADVYAGNTSSPYCNYAVATACTIAESRALKKALKLVNVTTSEEISSAAPVNMVELSTELQRNAIQTISERLDIDVGKLMKHMKIKASNFDDLSQDDAANVMMQLNAYNKGPDKGGELPPDEIIKE